MNLNLRIILQIANILSLSLTFEIETFEGRKYYFDHSLKFSWDEALAICLERGLQMANVKTKAVNDFLKETMHEDSDYWLGLNSFRRATHDFKNSHHLKEAAWYYPFSPLTFTDWCANEPVIPGFTALLSKDKCWRFQAYQKIYSIICESRTVEPVNSIEWKSRTYFFYQQQGITFFDAHRLCSANDQNLATIYDEELSNEINKEIKNKKSNYWIGLKSFSHYGIPIIKWHWNTTGRSPTYRNWCAPETRKSNLMYNYEWCGYIDTNEECWKSEVCDRDFDTVQGVICEDSKSEEEINQMENEVKMKKQAEEEKKKQEEEEKKKQEEEKKRKQDEEEKKKQEEEEKKKQEEEEKIKQENDRKKIKEEEETLEKEKKREEEEKKKKEEEDSRKMKEEKERFEDWKKKIEDENKKMEEEKIVIVREKKMLEDERRKIEEERKNNNFEKVNFNNMNYYFYESDGISQQEANAKCLKNGHTLATIDNEDVSFFLMHEIQMRNKDYWIGLEAYIVENIPDDYMYWRWNNTHFDATYQNWCLDQIPNKNFNCSYATQDEACWMFTTCNQNNIKGFICEDTLKHTSEYDVIRYNGFEHFLFKQRNESWIEANEMCRSKNKQLLILNTIEKIDFFNKIVLLTQLSVWIGLINYIEILDNNKYSYWKWEGTGKDISYENWCPNEPLVEESMCGYITTETECWKSSKCENKEVMNFICEDKQSSRGNPRKTPQHALAIHYYDNHPGLSKDVYSHEPMSVNKFETESISYIKRPYREDLKAYLYGTTSTSQLEKEVHTEVYIQLPVRDEVIHLIEISYFFKCEKFDLKNGDMKEKGIPMKDDLIPEEPTDVE